MKKFIIAAATAILSVSAAPAAAQATYPDKPLKFLVPYPPGSGTDTIARYTARRLESKLGQPVVVENRTGGNAIIAAQAVINAPPDGYTLLWAANGPVTTNVALYKSLPYDPLVDLQPVARIAYSPMGLLVPQNSPFKTAKELLDSTKNEPMKLNYGSGSATYSIATEWLLSIADGKANQINYKGAAPTIADVAGGVVDFTIVELSAALPLVQAGKVKLLAVTSDRRVKSLADIPTLQELGYGDFFQVAWWGLFAPKNTPAAIVGKLETALLDIYSDAESQRYLDQSNFSDFTASSQQLRSFQEAEIKRETGLVKQFNIPQL